MRKHLTKFLLIFAAVLCFSVTASAQKTGDKKGERKPPKIVVPKKETKPKDKNGSKKPKTIAKFIQAKVGANVS